MMKFKFTLMFLALAVVLAPSTTATAQDVYVGDVNRDCEITFLDIAPFMDALTSGIYDVNADTNQDGVVNFLDIGPFTDLLAFPIGDVNKDGVVDFLDIGPFIDALQSSAYVHLADVNHDGEVNFLDIQPLIDAISGRNDCDQADIMLVLDRSGSVGSDIATLRTATTTFVDSVAPAPNGVNIGVVSFNESAILNQPLSSDGDQVNASINGLFSGGGTNIAAALTRANTELVDNDRPDATSPDIMILVSDGMGNNQAAELLAAAAAKDAGVQIYTVGVGSGVDQNQLEQIASDPSDYYPIADFDELEEALQDIIDVCGIRKASHTP